jgi:ADP-heptose:LPS heptosyltransferase
MALKILLNRTDAIGDLILTLPMVDVIKRQHPDAQVTILGRSYTAPIVAAAALPVGFVDWSELEKKTDSDIVAYLKDFSFDAVVHVFPNKRVARLAKKAGIAVRVGTRRRLYHLWTCNRRIKLSRRNSTLHEAQLNIKLLEGLNIPCDVDLTELQNMGQLQARVSLPKTVETLLPKNKPSVILHPKSKGSAREWDIRNFALLAEMLHSQGMEVFVTGTSEEGKRIKSELGHKIPHAHDVTGTMTLPELITFISHCQALVAASTGPLHIASALGIHAVGMYPPIKPMHPGRWAPIGKNATVLCSEKECSACRKQNSCSCMQEILPDMILRAIQSEL